MPTGRSRSNTLSDIALPCLSWVIDLFMSRYAPARKGGLRWFWAKALAAPAEESLQLEVCSSPWVEGYLEFQYCMCTG